jgi:hypothetical protein
MRRGELWESTAVPEIRDQAAGVAAAVHDELAAASRRRRRPVPADDLMGEPLRTTTEAAAAYS